MSTRIEAFDYHEVDASDPAISDIIHRFNALYPDDFYELEPQHLQRGIWFLVSRAGPPFGLVGFAGSVPFVPFENYLYFKRVGVLPEYRGNSVQRVLMQLTESLARKQGYTHMISTTDIENIYSANNFIRTGWLLTRPEKPWEPSSLYWLKKL